MISVGIDVSKEKSTICILNTPWRMVRIDRWSWCIVAV